jgi:hypothetical protein
LSSLELAGELPFGTELPGTIRFFEDKNVEAVAEFETLVRLGCTEATDVLNPTLRLGLNMYSKETTAGTSLAAQAKTVNMSQAAALKAFSSSPGDKSGQWRKGNISLYTKCGVALSVLQLPASLMLRAHLILKITKEHLRVLTAGIPTVLPPHQPRQSSPC